MRPLRERLGPGARARRSAKIQRRRGAGHVPPAVRPREDPELARARRGRLRSRAWGRLTARIGKLIPDASKAEKHAARGELARFLGLASGADATKKRRRRIRQQSQRRNRR